MSVDQRVREGLHTIEAGLTPVDTDAALARTTRRVERSRARRRVAGVLVAAAAVTAVAVLQRDPWTDTSPPVTDPPDARAQYRASVLDGRWQSEPVSFRDMADHLRQEGLGRWVGPLRERFGVFHDLRVHATFGEEELDFRLPGHWQDGWVFAADGDRMSLLGGHGLFVSSYRLDLAADGSTMTLELRTPADGSHRGIPFEVYQTALLTTTPFHRVP